MKNIYLIIFLLIVQCSSKLSLRPIEILFDYSNLNGIDKLTKELIEEEFDIVGNYMKDLLQYPMTSEVWKNLSKLKDSTLTCDNKEDFYFKKNDIKLDTTMLVLPEIIINPKTKSNFDPVLTQCIKNKNRV